MDRDEHDALRARVLAILTANLPPGTVRPVVSAPAIEVQLEIDNGSAVVVVAIVSEREMPIVRSTAWVLVDPPPSQALFEQLLRLSGKAIVGGFFLSESGDVGYSHSILGASMDEQELLSSVVAVATAADREDDLLRAQFGGRRWIDTQPDV